MEPVILTQVASLIRAQRWAALATLSEGMPFGSMVAYVSEAGFQGFLLHLSRLAAHTRHLHANPQACLVIGEQDDGRDDPQTLARLSIEGQVAVLPREDPRYHAARDLYLAKLPESSPLFDFSDFSLYRLIPHRARYVGGFARAYTLDAAQLAAAAGEV